MKDPRTQNGAERGHDDCDHCGEDRSVEDEIFHAFVVAGAEIFCNRNAEAGTTSHTEAEDEKLDAGAGSDARECLCAEYLADDRGVDDVVSLLQEVAD